MHIPLHCHPAIPALATHNTAYSTLHTFFRFSVAPRSPPTTARACRSCCNGEREFRLKLPNYVWRCRCVSDFTHLIPPLHIQGGCEDSRQQAAVRRGRLRRWTPCHLCCARCECSCLLGACRRCNQTCSTPFADNAAQEYLTQHTQQCLAPQAIRSDCNSVTIRGFELNAQAADVARGECIYQLC